MIGGTIFPLVIFATALKAILTLVLTLAVFRGVFITKAAEAPRNHDSMCDHAITPSDLQLLETQKLVCVTLAHLSNRHSLMDLVWLRKSYFKLSGFTRHLGTTFLIHSVTSFQLQSPVRPRFELRTWDPVSLVKAVKNPPCPSTFLVRGEHSRPGYVRLT